MAEAGTQGRRCISHEPCRPLSDCWSTSYIFHYDFYIYILFLKCYLLSTSCFPCLVTEQSISVGFLPHLLHHKGHHFLLFILIQKHMNSYNYFYSIQRWTVFGKSHITPLLPIYLEINACKDDQSCQSRLQWVSDSEEAWLQAFQCDRDLHSMTRLRPPGFQTICLATWRRFFFHALPLCLCSLYALTQSVIFSKGFLLLCTKQI